MLEQDRLKSQRLKQKLWREFGDVLTESIACNNIFEIMLNSDNRLWVQDRELGLCYRGEEMSAVQAMNLIGTIASLNNKIVNEDNPILECELPFLGHRFEAVVPPVVTSPVFCIRKRAIQIFSLEDYVSQQIITAHQASLLREAIKMRKTIIVVGGPGTGKTTFANSLLHEMSVQCGNSQRIIILEDTHEIQSSAPNTVFLQTTSTINFQHLLRAALRLRPDRICMGECRGVEMLTLLKCWNTGTPGGLATLHANSARSALSRIQEMVAESGSHPKPQLIAEAVNIIVSLSFHPVNGRIVNEILEVTGYENQDFQLTPFVSGSPLCVKNALYLEKNSIN
jgi:P-type conjugative transfer ATPase TrbB